MNSKQFLKEGFLEDAQEAHSDHEVQMARVDCYYAAEHAIVLHKLLRNISEEQGLEGWVASKITLANDYLKSVREHLEYQMMNVDAGEDDFLPLAEGLKPVKKNSVVESTAPVAEDEEEKFQDFERGPWYVILKGKAVTVNGMPKKFNWLNGAKTYFRSMMDKNPEMAQKIKREYDEASDKKSVIYYTKNLPADNTTSTEQPVSESEKPGLWANIRAKRERIKGGSGERMRKPGSKGAPSDKDLKSIRAASESVVKEGDLHSDFGDIVQKVKGEWEAKRAKERQGMEPKYAPEQSRAELESRLRELESEFDPAYQYSDDYSFWTKQNAIAREIASIKKKLGSQGVAEAKSLKKHVRVVQGEHAGKTGWIREIKHGAFKGAPKRYYVDIDGGGQANNLPAEALRLIKDEQGVAEGYKEPTDAAGHAKMAAKIKKMLDDTLADRGDRHGNPDPQRLTRAYEYHMEKAKENQGVAEEVEQIDELNKDTLYSYNKKAETDVEKKDKSLGQLIRKGDSAGANKAAHQLNNRLAGQERAEKRLNKEVEGVAEGEFDQWGGEIKTPPANWKKGLKQPTSPAKLAKQKAVKRQQKQQGVKQQGVAEGLSDPTRKVFFKVIKTQGTGMPSGYRRVKTITPLEDGGFYIELSTPGYGMNYTRHNYKNFSLKDGQGKPITGQEAYDIINGQQGVAEGSSDDLVYISVDRVEAFEDWMDSEGLETNVPKTDEGTYVVYDYSNADYRSKMYASDWNEKKGVAEGSSDDLVYISVDRVEAFEDWMDSEGLETNVPKTDEGTYVVYDYSNADYRSKMYASDWNEKKGVAEGYILKKTKVEKTFTPGDPDEYYTSGGADVTRKDTDYEIINNKTGQVVGTASWTTNDYFGPGALKITMKNGATRWLDIYPSERGNPQTAFNRFVKDPKTAKKYKEEGVAEGGFDDASPMTKDSVKADRIRSLKNLIAIAKEQGRQLRVQELELELKKLQGVAEGSDNSVEALIQIYNNRDQKIVKTKVFASEEEANRWADRNNATILKLKDVAKKSTLDETSAGSIAGVVNPKIKNKSKVGTLFGGTYKQQKDK